MRTSRWMLLISTLGIIALASPAVALNYGGGSDASVISNGVTCVSAMYQIQPGNNLALSSTNYGGGSNALSEQFTLAKTEPQPQANETAMAHGGGSTLSHSRFVACSTTVKSPWSPGPVNGFY